MCYCRKLKRWFSYVCHAQTKLDLTKHRPLMKGTSNCRLQGLKGTLIETWREESINVIYIYQVDRLYGLVVIVLGYRSEGPGSIPGTTRKKSSGSGTGSILDRKSSGSCLENLEYGRRDQSRWPRGSLYPQKVGNFFADKRRSLGRYSSLADSYQGVFFYIYQVHISNKIGSKIWSLKWKKKKFIFLLI
jgi:hypothetical protein